jgi:hypothetical protein
MALLMASRLGFIVFSFRQRDSAICFSVDVPKEPRG